MPDAASPPISTQHRGLLGIKGAIELLVVALIGASVARGFVGESFVIPTGSMAPGLYGLHETYTCWACGTEFACGLVLTPDGGLRRPGGLICPNCGHTREAGGPLVVENGDRIFVLKWPFEVGRLLGDIDPHEPRRWWHVLKPRRWDVVVFKDPKDGTTNVIKRLIGLPGEVLEIIDGDIYTARAAELAETPQGRAVLEKLEQGAFYEHLEPNERRTLDRALKIRRKTARAQGVLWLSSYDHDFMPARRPALARWRAADKTSGWETDRRALRFTAATEGSMQEIAFVRGQPEWADDGDTPSLHAATDLYAYNGSLVGVGQLQTLDVSDLRLRCVLIPRGGQGQLALSLSKQDDRFVATFNSEGDVQLTRSVMSRSDSPADLIGRAHVDALETGEPVRLALSHLDYRVTVWVEDRPIIQTRDDQYPALRADGPDSPAAYARSLQFDSADASPQIRIGAAGMDLELRHVAIERDVYYRSPRARGRGVQGRPIYLRNRPEDGIQEYFCLGDNSPMSHDGRLWDSVGPHLTHRLATGAYQYGTVPADQMLGRAFSVFWPASYPLIGERLRVVPNIGDVRIIR